MERFEYITKMPNLYSWESLDWSQAYKRVETNQWVAEYNLYSMEYQSSVETLFRH